MAVVNRTVGDIQVTGDVNAGSLTLNNASITNAMISPSAAIAASKLQHAHRQVFADAASVDVADKTQVIHVVKGVNGTLKSFSAGCITPPAGTASVAVDLKKNGTTVLSSPILLGTAVTSRSLTTGTIGTAAVVADDVLEVSIDYTAGTQGTAAKGVFAFLDVWEDAE